MDIAFVAPGSELEIELMAHRERLEATARAGLLEPSFDLAAELARPFRRVYAALSREVAGAPTPIGLLFASRVADELGILSVIVADAWRRRGVGRALVKAALEDEARDKITRVALLEVRRQNLPAVRLYRSLGFVATRLRRDYYDHPPDDAVEMAAEIEAGALAAFGAPLSLD